MGQKDEKSLCVMAVHAHPDDECVFTGATLAKYSTEGVRTVLVTCTLGEEGEILDPRLDPEEAKGRLGEIRKHELECSVAELGISKLHLLGYHDTGMINPNTAVDPNTFWNADFDEAAGKLVQLIRTERPDVLVTYDEYGGYGHPDHIMAHRITMAAFEAAGNPTQYSEYDLPPWQPQKLYHAAFSYNAMMTARKQLLERGIDDPWARREEEASKQAEDPEAAQTQFQRRDIRRTDDEITTRIDAREFYQRKRASLRCHATQFRPEHIFLSIPDDLGYDLFGIESFVLVKSTIETKLPETDLFAGIRQF